MEWLAIILLTVVVWTFAAREAVLRRQIEMLTVQLAAIEEQQIEAAERAGQDRKSMWRLGLQVSVLQHRSEALRADIRRVEERVREDIPERRGRAQAAVAKFTQSLKAASSI